MPFDFFENQLVPHRRKVEAHCCVVDEGLGNVAEVHFLEQLCGRPSKPKHSRAVGTYRTVAIEEAQACVAAHS